ncbi:MAG: YhdH/YhfP family quinone oxidoreductase [Ignavibacteriales bacterium]|nr:MAG: YhdH/YhfP family quinone oxidoreductase [Ignavibacteriales bacterium]
MIPDKFKAMIVTEENGKFVRTIGDKKINDLPGGEVLIKVKFSSLNYKDALSASGNKGVTRKYPHTPGIDAAGIVAESSSGKFKLGEEVLVTGYDLGMNTSGGFGEYIRVPEAWVVKLPSGLTLKESMIYGTAGFTAGLSLLKLEHAGLKKENGEVLVTGASGGVGSMAVAILSNASYNVVAATGKKDSELYLKKLGAARIINRSEVDDEKKKPLLTRQWAGVVETVGGNILSTVLAQTEMGCSVASCGNAKSFELNTTVFPFILRGVNLLGINSAETLMDTRLKVWEKLAADWKPSTLEMMYEECSLDQLSDKIDIILKGGITGRVLVNLD